MLKIVSLFFVCMYSVDFITTLDRAILPALIIDPRCFSPSVGGGSIFHRILIACSLQIYVYVLIFSLFMFSYFHPVLGRPILPLAVDGSP